MAQMERQFCEAPDEEEPRINRRAYMEPQTRRRKLNSSDEEVINPMIGFGVPRKPGLMMERPVPILDSACGPPYFYYESVSVAPWNKISSRLYGIKPEFVDSVYFCAAARKRGYIHSEQNAVIQQCKKWNLVWVGKNKAAPLEPDEVEKLLGFLKDHTREGGISRTDRYKCLGNSFQVNTVSYHLSVLKPLYPNGIKILSLFTGIGGGEVALHLLQIPMNLVVLCLLRYQIIHILLHLTIICRISLGATAPFTLSSPSVADSTIPFTIIQF